MLPVALLVLLVGATVAVAALTVPGLRTEGSATNLGALPAADLPPLRGPASEVVTRTPDGYLILPGKRARVAVRIPATGAQVGGGCARTWLTLIGTSPIPGATLATVVSGSGERKRLGLAGQWSEAPIDVTDMEGGRRLSVHLDVTNGAATHYTFFSGASVVSVPCEMEVDTGSGPIGAWFALVVMLVLALAGRLRKHWPLVPVTALAAALMWRLVPAQSIRPPGSIALEMWESTHGASLFGIGDGLISGAATATSPLAAPIYDLLTPIVGTGQSGVLVAAALLAPLTVIAVYLLAERITAVGPAVVAALLVVTADPFRLSGSTGSPAPVLTLAAVGLTFGIWLCLVRVSLPRLAVLAGAGALCALAFPAWLPGICLAVVVVPAVFAAPGSKLRSSVITAALLLVLLAPSRVGAAENFDGDLAGDVNATAKAARTAETAPGTLSPIPPGSLRFAEAARRRLDRRIEAILARAPRPDSIDAVRVQQAALPLYAQRTVLAIHIGNLRAVKRSTAQGGAEPSQVAADTDFLGYLTARHIGSTLSGSIDGAQAAIDGLADRPETKLGGLLAFVFVALGSLYLLVLPRLRALILIPLLAVGPALHMAFIGGIDPLLTGLIAWPGMLMGAAALSYAAANLIRERYGAGGADGSVRGGSVRGGTGLPPRPDQWNQ